MAAQTVQIQLTLPYESFQRLEEIAHHNQKAVGEMASLVLEEWLDDPTEDQILASLRDSMRAALRGEVVSFDEAMAELKAELGLRDD